MQFTEKQSKVIRKLYEMYEKEGHPISPTKIGLELGFDYNTASSKCSNALKKAEQLGVVEKVKGGKYVPTVKMSELDI